MSLVLHLPYRGLNPADYGGQSRELTPQEKYVFKLR